MTTNILLAQNAPGSPATRLAPPAGVYSSIHMELLYHWCTTTSLTMSRSPELTTVWRTAVTELGLQNDFVLSAIMSIAARHLSRRRPSEQTYYEDIASKLQQRSLETFKDAEILPHVAAANCDSMFIFSSLIWTNCLATRKKPGDKLHILSAANWLTLLRGVTAVARSAKSWLPSGILAPMLPPMRRWDKIDTPSEADEQLNRLTILVSHVEDAERRLLYTKAITDLQKAFSIYSSLDKGDCNISIIFQWCAQLSEEYVGLLMSCDPEALVIFAHFAVLMSKALPCWWLEGRVEWLLASIHSHLGECHRIWIQWPIEKLGWILE